MKNENGLRKSKGLYPRKASGILRRKLERSSGKEQLSPILSMPGRSSTMSWTMLMSF
jgi:hypothetical protein